MASQAILGAWVIPGLRTHARGGLDRDVLLDASGQEIRIAVVRPPLVSDAIHSAMTITHQQTGFETAFDGGIGVVDRQIEVLYKHSAVRKAPLPRRRESDFSRRHRYPARLGRAIGPEGHDEFVGYQRPIGRQS